MKSCKKNTELIRLIEENRGIIHKVSLLYTSNVFDKEDLFQEICLQLCRSFGSYRQEAKFSTWLYRVSLNTAINSIRENKRKIFTVELNNAQNYAVKTDDKEGQTKMLMDSISRLNKIDKALILLWLEGKKYEEIAEIMGLTRSNVSVKLVRIRKKLEEIIKKMENE
jgi:RNA polymerase sigma-70 factor, ECF subfamily